MTSAARCLITVPQYGTGSVDKILAGLSVGANGSAGNVLVIPNRTPSGAGRNVWTVLGSLSDLSLTSTKPGFCPGYYMAPFTQTGPTYIKPTLLTEYATPDDTQIEARPAAGWSGVGAIDFAAPPSDLVAHWGLEGHVTGTTRALGAWATPA